MVLENKQKKSGPVAEAEDFVIKTLINKFFILVKNEKIGRTKELTAEIDDIVHTIRVFQEENRQNAQQDNQDK